MHFPEEYNDFPVKLVESIFNQRRMIFQYLLMTKVFFILN